MNEIEVLKNNYSKNEILEMYLELKEEYNNYKRKEIEFLMEHEFEKNEVIDKYIKLKKRFNYLKNKDIKHLDNLFIKK